MKQRSGVGIGGLRDAIPAGVSLCWCPARWSVGTSLSSYIALDVTEIHGYRPELGLKVFAQEVVSD